MRALWAALCARCDELIHAGDEIAKLRGGKVIHKGCASGQDDE